MYKPLREAAALLATQGKTLDQPLSGSPYLEAGKLYDVRIVSVDLAPLHTQGRISLSLESQANQGMEASVWPMDRYTPNKFGRPFLGVLNALFLNENALKAFGDGAMVLGDVVFTAFRGMSVRVQVGWGPGYVTDVGADGTIQVLDSFNKNRLIPGQFGSVTEARDSARRAGLKRAFTRVTSYSPISPEVCDGNWDAFNRAVATLTKIKRDTVPPVQTEPPT